MADQIKASVFIVKLGSKEEVKALVEYIQEETLWSAYAKDDGTIVMGMRACEIGEFAVQAAADPKLSWIEYTFQLDV